MKILLGKNSDLVITHADKTKEKVVMTKTDYDNKMSKNLDDNATYALLAEDPTEAVKTKITRLNDFWKTENYITKNFYIKDTNLPTAYRVHL